MTMLKEMFPVQYFRGSDLKEPTAVLTDRGFHRRGKLRKKRMDLLVRWRRKRGLRLSFKNAERLALAAKSENNQDWIGLRVRLSPKSFTNSQNLVKPGTTIDLEVVQAPARNGGPGERRRALPQSQEPQPQSPKPTAKPAPEA